MAVQFRYMIPLLVAYQGALCFQGLDLTDEGFWASFYQSIFVDPSSVRYGFMYWLTGVVGGAWLSVFPAWGLLGLRGLGVLVQTLTVLLAADLLRPFVRRTSMNFGLAACVVLVHGSVYIFFGNVFSSFLLMVSITCFWRFIRRRQLVWLVAAGWVIGISPFARLPNVTSVVGVSIPLLYLFLKGEWSWREAGQICSVTLMGVSLGVVSAVGLLAALGHGEIFREVLLLIGRMGAERGDQGHHSLDALIGYQLRMYGTTLGIAIAGDMVVRIGIRCFSMLGQWIPVRLCRVLIWSVALIVAGCLAYCYVRFAAMKLIYYCVLAMGAACAVHDCYWKRATPERTVVWWSAFLMMGVLPLGSNVPQSVVKYGLWILVPLTVDAVCGLESPHLATDCSKARKKGLPWIRAFCSAVGLAVVCSCVVLVWRSSYRDTPARLRLQSSISGCQIDGIFTTAERAKALSELLQRLTCDVKPGDTLLAYADMPMVHFLTNTRPFLNNAWPKLYTPELFALALETAVKERRRLPVVLRQRVNVGMREWPVERVPYLDATANVERTRILDGFMIQNGYACTWQNDNFDLWKPDRSSLGGLHKHQ